MSDLKGCAGCKHGKRDTSISEQIDVCMDEGETGSYLPIYMDIDNQRPAWCPGFEEKIINHETHENHETIPKQQELFGFRRD